MPVIIYAVFLLFPLGLLIWLIKLVRWLYRRSPYYRPVVCICKCEESEGCEEDEIFAVVLKKDLLKESKRHLKERQKWLNKHPGETLDLIELLDYRYYVNPTFVFHAGSALEFLKDKCRVEETPLFVKFPGQVLGDLKQLPAAFEYFFGRPFNASEYESLTFTDDDGSVYTTR